MSLWWLQEGWTDARCVECGDKIWPEGDPDWGRCWPCMKRYVESQHEHQEHPEDETDK